MNKSILMKRAWSAYRTKMVKFNNGKIKNAPKFASCLKWSWKIEKENMADRSYKANMFGGNSYKIWKTANMMRIYFSDNSYAQYKRTAKNLYEVFQYATSGVAEMVKETYSYEIGSVANSVRA